VSSVVRSQAVSDGDRMIRSKDIIMMEVKMPERAIPEQICCLFEVGSVSIHLILIGYFLFLCFKDFHNNHFLFAICNGFIKYIYLNRGTLEMICQDIFN
jgi:hypothetical protein